MKSFIAFVLGTVAAEQHDIFNIRNLMQVDIAKSIFFNSINDKLTASQGVVRWSECKRNENFLLDLQNTHTEPSPIKKGGNLDLVLKGKFKEETRIDFVNIKALYQGKQLYEKDMNINKSFTDFKEIESFTIPAFLPPGAVEIQLEGFDKSQIDHSHPEFCINAKVNV